MEYPLKSSSRTSGIPRLSRLPVPREREKSDAHKDPVKYTLPKRAGQKGAFQYGPNPIASTKPRDEGSMHSGSALIKPTNDLDITKSNHVEKDLEAAPLRARTLPRRPRPSLSDRTIETLSQIPPSPSPQRRKSSFFQSESPSRPSSRAASPFSRSRPGTSHGQHPHLPSGFPTPRPPSPTKPRLVPTAGNKISKGKSSRRSISSYLPKDMQTTTHSCSDEYSTPSKIRPPKTGDILAPRDEDVSKPSMSPVRASKTLAARPSRPRPPAQDAFPKPSKPPERVAGTRRNANSPVLRVGLKVTSTESSEESSTFSPLTKRSSRTTFESGGRSLASQISGSPKLQKSSATLRETIAKAKAARYHANKIERQVQTGTKQSLETSPDLEIEDSAVLLRKRVAAARTDGRLNIAGLGLEEMPSEVMNMYNLDFGDGAWYESVDLVKLIAADNEFGHLEDEIFPDEATNAHEADEYQGNLFGAIETLDLHGNRLKALPLGLRRLEHLTTLNISKNCLTNDVLSVVSQIAALRELRLAGNALEGIVGEALCDLENLEVLDLHDNAITALPNSLYQLSKLRTINVAGNRMQSLPLECFSALPLSELDASRNRLCGSLFPPNVRGLANLRVLDVANNALTMIAEDGNVSLPELQSLNVTENRLITLPDVSACTELLTVSASGNQLSSLPYGLTSLKRLKAVDFTRNDLRKLDERLGLMDSLTMLRVVNNPLRERRLLNLDTDELKRELKAQIIPEENTDTEGFETQDLVNSKIIDSTPSSQIWSVNPSGILDCSSIKLETIEAEDLQSVVEKDDIRTFILHHNSLQRLPRAISLVSHSLANLDVSNNKLAGNTYLSEALSLPNLRSLDLSSNAISAFPPLLEHLLAPKLAELNVSRNRLSSLLPLRTHFPSLISLLAANNSIGDLEVDMITGLQVLDVSGNEIDHLEPKLGLLGEGGLRTFLVGGNRFRVPRRDVIEKGTDAVLTWLRGRIPEGEL